MVENQDHNIEVNVGERPQSSRQQRGAQPGPAEEQKEQPPQRVAEGSVGQEKGGRQEPREVARGPPVMIS